MNVLLVRPPDPMQDVNLLSHTKPMNLAYLAAYLRAKGFGVAIADYETEPYSDAAFVRLLREAAPSVVGVTCTTPTVRSAAGICVLVKDFDRRIVTVAGGPHANGLPVGTMEEFTSFDCLVFGEGESTLHELCMRIMERADLSGIDGLVIRKGDSLLQGGPRRLIADLDSLPFPAWDLMAQGIRPGHSSRGFSNRLPSAELFTSRGCPFACSFCAIQATFGKSVRFRKTSYVEEELRKLVRDYRVEHIVIADDTFTLRKDRAMEICEILSRCGIKSWNCDTRASSVDPELLKAMRESGCGKVAFGVESGSQRVIDLIGKKITVDQVRQAVSSAREAGIRHIEGNFILGSDPSETPEEVEMTRALIKSLPWTFVSVSIIVPYPGTPVYRQMRSRGQISGDASWEDFVMFGKEPRWRTDHFSAAELLRLQKRLAREFYLAPSYVLRQLASIRTLHEASYWFWAGRDFLRWYLTGKAS